MAKPCPLCAKEVAENKLIVHLETHYLELQHQRRTQSVLSAIEIGNDPAKAVLDLAELLVKKGFISEMDLYSKTGVDFRHRGIIG